MAAVAITQGERVRQAERLAQFVRLSEEMTAIYGKRGQEDVRFEIQCNFTHQMQLIASITRSSFLEAYKTDFTDNLNLLFDCLKYYCDRDPSLRREALEYKDEVREHEILAGFYSWQQAKATIKTLPLREALLRIKSTPDFYVRILALHEILEHHETLANEKNLVEDICKSLKENYEGNDIMRRVILEHIAGAYYYRNPHEALLFLAQNNLLCCPLYCGRILRGIGVVNLYSLFSKKAHSFMKS